MLCTPPPQEMPDCHSGSPGVSLQSANHLKPWWREEGLGLILEDGRGETDHGDKHCTQVGVGQMKGRMQAGVR